MSAGRYYRPAARRNVVDELRAVKRIIEHCVTTWTQTSISLDAPIEVDGRRHWWRKAEPAELPENRAARWFELAARAERASRQLAEMAAEAQRAGKEIIRMELEEAQNVR